MIGQRFDFLTNKNLAFGATIAVDVWMWTPFMILMTLAALGRAKGRARSRRDRSDTLVEAIWYIILPNGKFILMLGILCERSTPSRRRTCAPDDQRRPRRHGICRVLLFRIGFEAFQVGDAQR